MLLFRDDAYLRSCQSTVTAVDGKAVRLDRTVFYPMGGGQPGDVGRLTHGGGTLAVADTVKGGGADEVVHLLADETAIAPGTAVEAAIDWERRYRLMRMHTTLHLLCAVVVGHVTGGQIGADRSRLDFDVPSGALDKDGLAEALNRLIAADLPIATRWITDEELADRPELVRTMSVKPPTGSGRVRLVQIGPAEQPVDLQPCGGTHVASTAEIGRVEVVKIENKGRQNRRVAVALA